jgi:hypothetical protein
VIIPEGHVVVTDYVPISAIVFESQERMAMGDVQRAYDEYLRLGSGTAWPCIFGRWLDIECTRFKLDDGRHRYIASLMLGRQYMLAAWIQPATRRMTT